MKKNPNLKLAKAMRARYHDDVKAGHKRAAEYWRGQAAAYFTGNPVKATPIWSGEGVMLYTKDMSDKNSVGISNKYIQAVIHYLRSVGYIGIANSITLKHTSRGVTLTDYQGRRLFLTLKEKEQAIRLLSKWLKKNPRYHFKLKVVKNPLSGILTSVGEAMVAGVGLGIGFSAVDYAKKKIMKEKSS